MDALYDLPGRSVEVGRTCVDPNFRQGAAIAVLWSGLADFIKQFRVDFLFGCASIFTLDPIIIGKVENYVVDGASVREPTISVKIDHLFWRIGWLRHHVIREGAAVSEH